MSTCCVVCVSATLPWRGPDKRSVRCCVWCAASESPDVCVCAAVCVRCTWVLCRPVRRLDADAATVVQLLLLPEDPNCVLICVATGTGIAPYRAFWRRCFYEDVPGWKFTGLFWLFMGAANGDAKLYDNEIQEIAATCAPPPPRRR